MHCALRCSNPVATAPASTLTRRHKPLAIPNGVTPGQGNYLERRSPECRIAVPRRSLADPRRAVTRKECGTRGGAVAAWLRETYRPVIEQNPAPALAFMACFFGIMFGILYLMV